MELVSGSLELFTALIIFMLLISVYHEKYADFFEKCLITMMSCHIVVLLLDGARWLLHGRTDLGLLLLFLSIAPTIIALLGNAIFIYFAVAYLSRKGSVSTKITLPLILLFLFSLFVWTVFILSNGVEYAINMQTNHDTMNNSWGYWAGHMVWSSVCVIGVGILLRCRKGLNTLELCSLMSYCVFPLIALVLRFFWDGAQIFLSTALSLIWIHTVLYREQRQRLIEKEAQLSQSRIAILLSQIQPHFLYNTLNAICGLCDSDPREAQSITAKFADYLRHNLDSLNQESPIPFEKELKHVQIYLDIEQKRFGERLHIVYDIEATNFNLPSLTIQPLVENAVKHGVMKRIVGGTVTLKTKEKPNAYEIIIMDDGIGFLPSPEKEDGQTHIGIENVRHRLFAISGGTLQMHSVPQKGTTAILTIPKQKDWQGTRT